MNAATSRAAEIRRQMDAITAEGKKLAKEYETIVRREMPDLLATLGTTVWKHDGIPVSLGTKVKGSISSAPDLEAAIEMLHNLGFGGAIKTTLSVEFGVDEEDECKALAGSISATIGKEAVYARAVNASTLAAWARDRLADGLPVDLEALGLSAWREATVTVKK